MESTGVVTRIHITTADRSNHLEVPFNYHGEGWIQICFAYDKTQGIVDFGLRDPDGWRGYSGGARSRITLHLGQTTPGYRDDPLPVGRWFVEFGVYRIFDDCDVTLEVQFVENPKWRTEACREVEETAADKRGIIDDADGTDFSRERLQSRLSKSYYPDVNTAMQIPRGSARGLPSENGLTWFAGDFHSHSLHSDGWLSLDELACLSLINGLDFLAVTDHNTISHHRYLDKVSRRRGLLLIPGQEVTTDWGHANVFGDIGWVDFHDDPDSWLNQVHDRHGIMSINHPIADHCAWQWRLKKLPPVLEFWHSTWFRDQTGSGLTDSAMFALWSRWSQEATIIGGGDFHTPNGTYPPGVPTTWVQADELSVHGILDAVSKGRTAISTGVSLASSWGNGADLRDSVLLPVGDAMIAISCENLVLVLPDGRHLPIRRSTEYFNQTLCLGLWRVETLQGAVVSVAKTASTKGD